MRTRRPRPAPIQRSIFAGFCFPPEVIVLAVRWCLRFGLSYRDVEELLAERGIRSTTSASTDGCSGSRRCWPRPPGPAGIGLGIVGRVDETCVKVAGRWRYVYRAIDQAGQVIDVLVSQQRDGRAARRFFERAIGTTRVVAVEIVTDRAPTYPVVLEELLPAAWHRTDRYANNRVEADHGRLKARLRPMRRLKRDAVSRP